MLADLLIVAILIVFAIIGWKRGFVKTTYSLLSIIISVMLVYMLRGVFVEFVAESALGKAIGDFFAGSTPGLVADKVASGVIYIFSSIVLYLIIRLSLKFLLIVLEKAFNLPVIKQINSICGFVFGVLSGFFWVVLGANILCLFDSMHDFVVSSYILDVFNLLLFK